MQRSPAQILQNNPLGQLGLSNITRSLLDQKMCLEYEARTNERLSPTIDWSNPDKIVKCAVLAQPVKKSTPVVNNNIHQPKAKAPKRAYNKKSPNKRVTFVLQDSETPIQDLNPYLQMVQSMQNRLNYRSSREKRDENEQEQIQEQQRFQTCLEPVKENFDEDEEVSIAFDRHTDRIISRKSQINQVPDLIPASSIKIEKKCKPLTKKQEAKQKKKEKKANIRNQRPQTFVDGMPETENQIKKRLRSGLDHLVESQALPSQNLYIEEMRNFIGSYGWNKMIKKRKLKDLEDEQQESLDYTEVIFNKEEHGAVLDGLYSRQYDPSFFEDLESDKFKNLMNEIEWELWINYSSQEKTKLANLLNKGSNQLLIIYDPRLPRDIMNSKNRQSVLHSQGNPEARIIGYAVFQKTISNGYPGIFIHKLFGRQRRKSYKKKVIHGLNVTQDRFRAQQMLIAVSKSDQDLYRRSDYTESNISRDELDDIGIEQKITGQLMVHETQFKSRDLKKELNVPSTDDLKKMPSLLVKSIQSQMEWIEKNKDKIDEKIQSKVKSKAVGSDQAKTPIWLMNLIKRFLRLTDQEIYDVFIFRQNWSA